MAHIPETFTDLLSPTKKAFAYLGLVKQDGTPQVTPLWFDYDGQHFIVNTARGRLKDKLLRKRPAVSLVIQDPGNPYRYLQVRGPVVDETEQGAYETICGLNNKYHGNYEYPKHPGEVRVTYKILPEHVDAHG